MNLQYATSSLEISITILTISMSGLYAYHKFFLRKDFGNSPIAITSELPWLSQNYVTSDASDKGVILDGSLAGGEWVGSLVIDLEWNIVQGLQIIHFTGAGIVLHKNAAHNIIGGDPNTGSGPLGQGNLSSANADGIALFGAINNTITGNLIGTDVSGTNPWANRGVGVLLQDGAQGNLQITGLAISFYWTDMHSPVRQGSKIGLLPMWAIWA